jgi:hypothetical protein
LNNIKASNYLGIMLSVLLLSATYAQTAPAETESAANRIALLMRELQDKKSQQNIIKLQLSALVNNPQVQSLTLPQVQAATAAPGTAAPGTAAPGTAAQGTAAQGTAAQGTAAQGTAAQGTATSGAPQGVAAALAPAGPAPATSTLEAMPLPSLPPNSASTPFLSALALLSIMLL